MYTHSAPRHTGLLPVTKFPFIWSPWSYCLRTVVIVSADSPLFPYWEKWLLLGLRDHSLSVNLQSITGRISPIALRYNGWLHCKKLFLDSVHFYSSIAFTEQSCMKRTHCFTKTKTLCSLSFISSEWLIKTEALDSLLAPLEIPWTLHCSSVLLFRCEWLSHCWPSVASCSCFFFSLCVVLSTS